jgi:hypothetical protein
VAPEALGPDHAAARERAVLLNRHLAAWRDGRGAVRDLDHSPRFGTLAWLAERYRRSKAWDKVSARARPDYVRAMAMVLDIPLRNGTPFGDVAVTAVSARAVDAAYARLRDGPNGRRTRQAVVCVVRMARAWDVVARLYPDTVPAANPWRGVELDHGRGTTKPATRAEMMALHRALAAMGEMRFSFGIIGSVVQSGRCMMKPEATPAASAKMKGSASTPAMVRELCAKMLIRPLWSIET